MANTETRALSQQIASDPRVKAWITQRYPRGTRGAAEIPADLLQSWGYVIPDGYGVAVQGGAANVYNKFDKWDVILPAAAAAGGAWGAAGAPGLASGAGGTASSAVPTTINAAGVPVNMSAGATAGMTPLGGLTPAQAAAWGAAGRTGTGAAPTGVLDILKNPKTWLSLAPIIGALATRGVNNDGTGGAGNAFLQKAYDDAQANNALKETRFRRVDPLHQAVTQLAFNRLPDNATQGLSIDPMALPPRRT